MTENPTSTIIMGATESKSATLPDMIELESILKPWAWQIYEVTTDVQTLRYEDVDLDVIWDKVHFDTSDVSYEEKKGPLQAQSTMVFKSDFENNTKEIQEHKFTTQRTTVSTCTTILTNGFTRGVKTGIRIPVPPEVLDVTSGFGNEVVVETDERNTAKHSMTWTANSKIRLPPMSRTVAKLQIEQQQFDCYFGASVTMKGRVKIRITNNRTGMFVKTIENDVATIVKDRFQAAGIVFNDPDDPGCVRIVGKRITWPVVGHLSFKYGVSQKVEASHANHTKNYVR